MLKSNSENNDREQNWLLLSPRVKKAESNWRATVTLGCPRWYSLDLYWFPCRQCKAYIKWEWFHLHFTLNLHFNFFGRSQHFVTPNWKELCIQRAFQKHKTGTWDSCTYICRWNPSGNMTVTAINIQGHCTDRHQSSYKCWKKSIICIRLSHVVQLMNDIRVSKCTRHPND
jgi:hypothetical protein